MDMNSKGRLHSSIFSRRRIAIASLVVVATLNKLDTITIHEHQHQQTHRHFEVKDVEWVHDEVWFNKEVEKGCCPFAKVMYEPRYTKVNYRCCTERIAEGKIDFLRAVGGADYLQLNKNTTILIQGDSLAEQHFLGMICFAWSAHNMTVDLRRVSQERDHHPGTTWKAQILVKRYVVFNIQFLRWDKPQMASEEAYALLDNPDFIILGGWHHGLTASKSIESFLTKVQNRWNIMNHQEMGRRVFVVDPLPSHFPGGAYIASGQYPAAIYSDKGDEPCEKMSLKRGNPNIHEELIVIRKRTNVTLLDASRLYSNRGDAQVGFIPQAKGRDCLHFCIAPGVMEALARMTLAAIMRMM
jgi:hypothetical protein